MAEPPEDPPLSTVSRQGDVWFIASGGVRQGPYERRAVESFWANGELASDALIWASGMPDWVPAHELFAASDFAEVNSLPEDVGPSDSQSVAPAPAAVLRYERRSAQVLFPPAGFWRRFLAWFIDWALLKLCWAYVLVLLVAPAASYAQWALALGVLPSSPAISTPGQSTGQSAGQFGGQSAGPATTPATAPAKALARRKAFSVNWSIYDLVFYGGYYAFRVAYFAVLEASAWQGTLGKRVMGLRVVSTSGQRLPLTVCFVRQLASVVSFFFGAGYLMIAATREKTALHDLMTGTRVVKARLPKA